MTTKNQDAASRSDSAHEKDPFDITLAGDDVTLLQAQMKHFEALREKCVQDIKDFRAREDMVKKVYFAREIFEQTQEKLRLDAEVELRRVRINRVNQGLSAQADPTCGGLL